MYGAIKGRRWFMLPWIICTFAFLLAYLAGMCLSLWLVGVLVFSLLLFFAALIEIVIALYLWMCVISLFQVKRFAFALRGRSVYSPAMSRFRF